VYFIAFKKGELALWHCLKLFHNTVVTIFTLHCVLCVDESDDEKEVSRKRTVRQAASKAVSKQREILLGDAGSEDEEQEDKEEPYLDRMYNWTVAALVNDDAPGYRDPVSPPKRDHLLWIGKDSWWDSGSSCVLWKLTAQRIITLTRQMSILTLVCLHCNPIKNHKCRCPDCIFYWIFTDTDCQ